LLLFLCYNISMKSQKIPQRLQATLWSVDVNHLDSVTDKHYIIHQVLGYGGFDEIKWLLHTYTKEEIKKIFLESPMKNYPKDNYYFAKNIILDLEDTNLNENKYITSISGHVVQRATGSF